MSSNCHVCVTRGWRRGTHKHFGHDDGDGHGAVPRVAREPVEERAADERHSAHTQQENVTGEKRAVNLPKQHAMKQGHA